MVTTRRSVFATPTIPVARAIRRERNARIAEAEILPPSQIVASRSTSGQQSKSGAATQKSRRKNKKEEEYQALSINPDFVPQISLSPVEHDTVPQVELSQVQLNCVPQLNLSQVSQHPNIQASDQLPSPDASQNPPDASQNPPAASQHQEAREPWLIRESTPFPELNLTQDSLNCSSDESPTPPAPQPQEELQLNLSQHHSYASSQATIQPPAPDGSLDPPPSSQPYEAEDHLYSSGQAIIQPPAPSGSQNPPPSQPRDAENFWVGSASDFRSALPDPVAPIFRPVESLIAFATGVPVVEETKPFDNDNSVMASNDPEVVAAHSARRREAISKAATAVMAHMDGHDVARSDYLSILDVQLADPDMRHRLPPALFEQYELAVKEKPATLYNGGLIDKFINATKRATNVTARILLTSKNAKRERRARGARARYHQPVDLNQNQQHHSQMVPDMTDAGNEPAPAPMAPQRAQQPPIPRLFPESSTQANLNRTPNHSIKGKAKEAPELWDEQRGVMRTTKGLVRPAPYPRRVPSDAFRVACALADSSGNTQKKGSREESSYSVYSASSVLQQVEAKKMAKSLLDGVNNMLDFDSHDAQCVRAAEAVLEEVRRTKGAQEAASIRRGFDLLHCYELVKDHNVNLLSHALLEHISEGPKEPFTPQLREHPQLGWGWDTYAPVFQPIGSSQPYTEPIQHPLP